MPKYSICITHLNNFGTIAASMTSILNQIDGNFEVVVVDNFSNDGSYAILKRYSSEGRIKLVQTKCSRGRGRQIAFENSTGDYVIANMDLDDIFYPNLKGALRLFHRYADDKLVHLRPEVEGGVQGITFARRELIEELGGWRDLQRYEDNELQARAAAHSKFAWFTFQLVSELGKHRERVGMIPSMRFQYSEYLSLMQLGRPLRPKVRPRPRSSIPYIAARIALTWHEKYPYDPNFDHKNEVYSLDKLIASDAVEKVPGVSAAAKDKV